MSLICRRFLSSIINGIIICIFLTAISLSTAFILWFFPLWSSIDMKWFYVLFAMAYSLLGSLWSSFLPSLGSRLAGIQLCEIKSDHRKKVKVFLRLFLFYSVPMVLLFSSTFLFNRIASGDPKVMVLLFAPLLFCALFTAFIIPTSIVLGKGRQGIHDALASLVICRSNGEIGDLMPFKRLVVRSVIATSVISVILLLVIFKFITIFKFQNVIFDVATTATAEGINAPIIKDFDSLIPITPLQYRGYDFADGFKWWVDLTTDTRTQISVNEAIGLKRLNAVDLLGYGFSVKKLLEPIPLLHIDRSKTSVLPSGSDILSIFVFVDVGAFYYPEIRAQIHKYFATLVAPFARHKQINVVRVKTLRIVKVGYVKLGFFDEFYVNDDGMWRDEERAYLPEIFNIDIRIARHGKLITSIDLE